MVRPYLVRPYLVWLALVKLGETWWCGVWCGVLVLYIWFVVWCGVVWRGVVWRGVVWRGVVVYDVVWWCMMWCGGVRACVRARACAFMFQPTYFG